MRIEKISERHAGFWLGLLLKIMKHRRGTISAPLLAYAWRPRILLMFLGLGSAVRSRGQLPEKLKRLAMFRAARQVECAF